MDHLERKVQRHYASRLHLIEHGLSLVGTEVEFPGGRIDILARNKHNSIAIELKAKPYSTQRACAQLMNYLNHFDTAYFLAPKVRQGVAGTLREHIETGRLRLFEYSPDLRVQAVAPADLDDTRPFNAPEFAPSLLDVVYPLPESTVDALVRAATYVAGRDGPYREHCRTFLAAREKLHKLQDLLRT